MRYFIILLLAVACRSVAPTTTTKTSDSTMVIVNTRVDTLYLPGEMVELPPIYIECDSTTNRPKPFVQKKSGKNVKLRAGLDRKGLLTINCKEDSLLQITKVLDSTIFRLRSEHKVVVMPPVVTHKPLWFDVMFRWWALITAAYLIWKNRTKLLGMLVR